MKRPLAAAVVALLLGTGAQGSVVSKLDDEALRPLRHAVSGRVRLDRLPLTSNARSVSLERFDVWAPGARVLVHGDRGVQAIAPPTTAFYRGRVAGYEDSIAVFAVGRTISGFVSVGGQRITLAPHFGRRALETTKELLEESDVDYYTSRESTPADLEEVQPPWTCDVERLPVTPSSPVVEASRAPGEAQAISGSQSYAITLEVETDYELYQSLGASASNVAQYVQNLVSGVSTIYSRDLKTNVTIANLHVYTIPNGLPGGSPWTASPAEGTEPALFQLSDLYARNRTTVKRSAVVLLSGRDFGGGIAWRATICGGDACCTGTNHWVGAYAFCSGIVPDTPARLPDPNETVDGVPYGGTNAKYYSAYTASYEWVAWPLAQVAHELGHIMGSPHTHCIQLTPAEQTAAGRKWVDLCYSSDNGCYGPDGSPVSVPIEKGTLMSYCHRIAPDYMANRRFTFGQPDEVSRHVQDDYLLRAAGPSGGGTNIVKGTTLVLPAITAAAFVMAGSSANSASIIPVSGATYAWSIVNGTITSGQASATVTFSAGTAGLVTLRVAAYAASGCGVTDVKEVPITPPAGRRRAVRP